MRSNLMMHKLHQALNTWIASQFNPIKHFVIQLDITNACNLECLHCYHHDHNNAGALDLDDWFTVLNQYQTLLNELGMKPCFVLCGGEPMTSKNLKPLLQEINRRWSLPRIYLLTNGTIIDQDKIKYFKTINLHIQVSLDGPDRDRHDFYRGHGSFDKAMDFISLVKENEIPIHLLSILSKRTSTWIEDFFKMAKHVEVQRLNFTRFIPVGYGKTLSKNSDRALMPEELKESYAKIIACSNRTSIETNTNQPLFHLINGQGGHNLSGFNCFVIDYRGKVKLSSRSDMTIGDVRRSTLLELYKKSPLIKSLQENKIEGCGDCSDINICGGDRSASYAHTGDFLGIDPGCWIINKKKEIHA